MKCPYTASKRFLASVSGKIFRCPFEVKGNAENTIVNVHLGVDRAERIAAISKGFETFHGDPKYVGLRLILPKSFTEECAADEEPLEYLHTAILPYQADARAGELEYRLYPFLPYQMQRLKQEEGGIEKGWKIFETSPYKFRAGMALVKCIAEDCGFPIPADGVDISTWIEFIFTTGRLQGHLSPTIKATHNTDGQNPTYCLGISTGQIILPAEHVGARNLPSNQNCFGIVKAPFYPKETGRHSDTGDVEMIMSREADFVGLPKEVRRKIRHDSNSVLRELGIPVNDLDEDKPEGEGVWVPWWKK